MATLSYLLFSAALLLALSQCSDPSGPVQGRVILGLTPSEVRIGLDSLVQVSVRVEDRTDGREILFQTRGGFFEAPGNPTTLVRQTQNRRASVFLRPPEAVGEFVVSAAGTDQKAERRFRVTAAPAPTIAQLPDTASTATKLLFSVVADPAWGLKPIEVKTTHGSLFVAGGADSTLAEGARVRPILDAQGRAFLQLTTPEEATTLLISAALFEAATTAQVTIQ